MASKSIQADLHGPSEEAVSSEENAPLTKLLKRGNGTLIGYADVPLTQAQRDRANVPPLAAESDKSDDYLAGPDAITDEELQEAFGVIDREKDGAQADITRVLDPDIELDGNEVLEGEVYDWKELEVIDKGAAPTGFMEDISVLEKAANNGQCDVTALLTSQGVTSLL
ncbi:hypothetical protein HYDPIDRAFT_33861 [Hydnomerulius pinastri MD-312]|uniref:Uncharacterized protein n=1 Tax=Hydnomerulius pinastri MD-312 TaxID=994086 RepID=A0A0C9VZ74_9AGAM|nr:hypothetical protein HYDPIDRAFT_33861 [Hydnomerulius pinastri MD-312]